MSIKTKDIEQFQKDFESDGKWDLAMNAVCKSGVDGVVLKRSAVIAYENQLPFGTKMGYKEQKVANQKSTGRCWLFAATNVIRLRIIKEYNLDAFELSQSYLFFWDKFEKANFFLENMIELADKPTDDRLIEFLLKAPLQDGGQYDMVINVIEKYGLVPKSIYSETTHSCSSRRMNWILTFYLREQAQILREMVSAGEPIAKVRQVKSAVLSNVYRVLSIFLGTPPKEFNWTFSDKDGNVKSIGNVTPLEFYKNHVPFDATPMVSLINDPRNAYGKLYTVNRLGNCCGGRPVLYINLPIEDLKKYAAKSIKEGEPVWFGCDVNKFFDKKLHSMDLEQFDYSNTLGIDFSQSKADRLRYGQSLMTHAMVFNAFDGDELCPTRWRIENSWGDANNQGFAVMTDKWFNEFMYQVVIDKVLLPLDITDILKQDPIVLPAWDPMGSLAE